MMDTDNFELDSRVSPDSVASDETRVSNDDESRSAEANTPTDKNDQKALTTGSKQGLSEYDFEDYPIDGKGRVTGAKQYFHHGYEIGDMVWGKVKSHPWWPGHIFDEVFASASVRRSKRKGLVLVAFFGDSSYGWFDPEELIPFEPHYAEKSKQINSKTFVKAVEEAADEASRRRGLGLACRCRKPFNFRPANVKGYFAVDTGENEPAAVYSNDQIRKARDGFRAKEMVAFMKGLAMMPKKSGKGNLDFLKDKAGVLAYRKAVYEEFDETYAQAFGQSPMQPKAESREALKHSVKAPLSGPMVIAETLGKKKTPTKAGKKGNTEKDKYLFKRRDDAKDMKSQETASSVQQPYVEVSTELADGDYVLQRRALPVPTDPETPAQQVTASEDSKPSSIDDSTVKSLPSDRFSDPTKGGVSITKKSEQSKSSPEYESKSVEGQDSRMKTEPGIKKVKNPKRPIGDLGADYSVTEEKKKKRKKEAGVGMSPNQMQKLGSAEKGGVSGIKVSKKQVKGDVESQDKDDRGNDDLSLSTSAVKTELKFRDLLSDLHALALDPFYGRERRIPALTRKVFLKFRSLVFQKSLVLSPPSEVETEENHDPKYPPGKSTREEASFKPPRPKLKPEDPAKLGRKRGPSDRQEEVAAKRLKKVTEIKSLTVEKKAAGDGRDGKVSGFARPQKPIRAEPGKKTEVPRKVRELTVLVMKFPPQSNLPSENELKARLARFGPLDHARTRIFWKTFTCKVVFVYKTDADAAHRYLSENNTLFGGVRVRCYTRPLEAQGPSDLETKAQDGPAENVAEFRAVSTQSTVQIKSCLKKSMVGEGSTTAGVNGGTKATSRVKFVLGGGENNEQLVSKSNLNKTSFTDGNIGSSTSSAVAPNNTSYGVELNTSKNIQHKVVTSSNSLSSFHSPQVALNVQYPQSAPANTRNFNTNMFGVAQAGPSSTNVDQFAQEMITLMTRCNDVVINLKSSLGYVPYHSL